MPYLRLKDCRVAALLAMTRNWDGFIWETGVFALCGHFARCCSAPFFKRFVLKTASFSSKPDQICHCEEGAFFAPNAAIFDGTRRHPGTEHGQSCAAKFGLRASEYGCAVKYDL